MFDVFRLIKQKFVNERHPFMKERQPLGLGIVGGTGRVGLAMLRNHLEGDGVPVKAITSRHSIKENANLLAYDSKFPGQTREVEITDKGYLINNEHEIYFLQTDDLEKESWSWKNVGADVVAEATGRGKKRPEVANILLKQGAKAVIITCPVDIPMYVMGVNHQKYQGEKVVSNGSCTTNAAAPIVKTMLDEFGKHIESINALTIHTFTRSNDQGLDKIGRTPVMGRSFINNIIPTSTGASGAIKKVIPELEQQQIPFNIQAVRVPLGNVSTISVSIVMKHNYSITRDEVLNKLRQTSGEELKGIMGIAMDNSVSSMFTGSDLSVAIVPEMVTVEDKRIVNIFGWYDNESGYAKRVGDLADHMIRKGVK